MQKGRGPQCQKRKIHQHMTMQQLKAEECEMAHGLPLTGGDANMESKQDFIDRLVSEERPDGHRLSVQTNYMVCQCGMRVLKNSAREKIQQLQQTTCWDGLWVPLKTWTGNPSHNMWRRGSKVHCKVCGGHAISRAGGWEASRHLQRPCTTREGQTQLRLRFKIQGQGGRAEQLTKNVREKIGREDLQ